MKWIKKVFGYLLAGWGAIRGSVDPLESMKATREYAELVYSHRYLAFGLSGPVYLTGVVVIVGGGLIFSEQIQKIVVTRWQEKDHQERLAPAKDSTKTPSPSAQAPSFLFVIGVPLGDNKSATWMMLTRHYGLHRAYTCTIEFIDLDRRNVEHEWLVKHANTPFLPAGMFDPSRKVLSIGEAGPEDRDAQFMWKPLDPNRQHYLVNVTCRDGYFTEKWEVTRINGILRARIIVQHGVQWIKNNPNMSPTVFQYQDPEFVESPLLAEIPNADTDTKEVHFGWKPNYRFEVPVAILDPTGNLQIMSGVNLPDGSKRTDFGFWNLLTKHLEGDI